jgi:UDPglucose 6-dehydrogenase
MKTGAINFKASAIQGIMKLIKTNGVKVVIYEPSFDGDNFFNSRIIIDLTEFKTLFNIVVANRLSNDIKDVANKIYTRGLLGKD